MGGGGGESIFILKPESGFAPIVQHRAIFTVEACLEFSFLGPQKSTGITSTASRSLSKLGLWGVSSEKGGELFICQKQKSSVWK